MSNYKDNNGAVTALLSNYFEGVFTGNAPLLREVFHPQAVLAGDIKGEPYFKTLDQYLDGVQQRKSPEELGETFRMEVLSIEIINSIAVAKARLPMFEFNYYDLLSLSKFNGEWKIVNKMLTHVNP